MGSESSVTPGSAAIPGARYQALDAWRGVVCLVVVLEHAGVALWRSGTASDSGPVQQSIVRALTLNLGAPLFFVISGYCIASSLESSRRKGVSPGRFLAKRLWRIFPPYWASAAIIGLLVVALDQVGLGRLRGREAGLELFDPARFEPAQWLGNVTLTETWRPLLGGPETMLLNRVAWALCYQEQFYLICFLCLVLAPGRLFGALAAATLAIVGFRLAMWDSGRLYRFAGLAPDLWHEFAVGLALYWRINLARTAPARRAVELGLVVLCGIGLRSGFVTTTAASAFGLLLIVCYRWDGAIARVGALDPLRACGRRSYAIYLIHLPVCTVGGAALAGLGLSGFWPRALLMVPATTAASVAAGWAFYRLVDRRFTRLPSLAGLHRAAPVARPGPSAEPEGPSGVVSSWSASA